MQFKIIQDIIENRSIRPIGGTLKGTTTPEQSGYLGIKGVLLLRGGYSWRIQGPVDKTFVIMWNLLLSMYGYMHRFRNLIYIYPTS